MNPVNRSGRHGWGAGALLTLLAVTALVTLSGLAAHGDPLGRGDDRLPRLEALDDLLLRAMDNARLARDVILETDEKVMAASQAEMEANAAANTRHLDYLQRTLDSALAQALLRDIVERREAYNAYNRAVLQLGLQNRNGEATARLYGPEYRSQAAYFGAIRKLIEQQKQQMAAATSEAAAGPLLARRTVVGLTVLSSLLGLFGLALIVRSGRPPAAPPVRPDGVGTGSGACRSNEPATAAQDDAARQVRDLIATSLERAGRRRVSAEAEVAAAEADQVRPPQVLPRSSSAG